MYKDSDDTLQQAADGSPQRHPHASPAPQPAARPAAPAAALWAGPERRKRHAASGDWPMQLLDEIDYGILVVDAFLHVAYANHSARGQLRQMPVLRLERGLLLADRPADTDRLATAVRAAATQRLRRMLVLGSGAQRCSVSVVPVPPGMQTVAARGAAQVLVMLPRPHLCEPLSLHGFVRDHGLSGAESQVLIGLCQGLQPSDIAAQQGVAISTVRTQIASLRQKTGAATVADLLQRIARLPPVCGTLQPEARAGLPQPCQGQGQGTGSSH